MRLRVLLDKEVMSQDFEGGWGVSYLVDDDLLFDTGEKFSYIEKNSKLMGIDLMKITKVVISHQHWDHIQGLDGLLEMNKGITVYVCAHSSKDFKDHILRRKVKLVEVKDMVSIKEGIYSSGESFASYKGEGIAEQSLIIDRGKDLVLLCGCAHFGLLNIIEKVRRSFNKDIYCLIGGFHLMDKEKRFIEYVVRECRKAVKKIAPSHCTGFPAVSLFREVFKEDFLEIKVGKEIGF
ncbi:MAG: MBL fold metallo-hydrolase [Candidatus Omnitrophica bacterium]|nr:MBL fold metallo-hydrolase [Candidatus Omnitrophota bacterium]